MIRSFTLAAAALALLLHVADVATTLAALGLPGSREGNPLGAALLAAGGPVAFALGSTLLIVAGLAVLLALGRRWRRDPDPLVRVAPLVGLAAFVLLVALPAAWNLAALAGYRG